MIKVIFYRKKAHKTQKDIAKLLNISAQSYSFKEQGRRPFKPKEMTIIRNYLSNELNEKLTIDELFF